MAVNVYKKILIVLLLLIVSVTIACTCNVADGKVYSGCYGNMIPCLNNTYNLGSAAGHWATLYVNNIIGWIPPAGAGTGNVTAIPGGTAEYIPYFTSSTNLANSWLQWDVATNRLGLAGTAINPNQLVEILEGTFGSPQLRLSYNQANAYTDLQTMNDGDFYIKPFSTFVGINDNTPSVALDVTGQIRSTDDISSGNDVNVANDLDVEDDADIAGVTTLHDQVVLTGSGLVHLRFRPVLDQATVSGTGKPVIVYRGLTRGYTMPLYAANQELFFTEPCVPFRWDGTSDFEVYVKGYLDTANNTKRFRLQVSWEHSTPGDVIVTTSHDAEVETLTGNWAQYTSFETVHTMDYNVDDPDNVIAGDLISMRIRRINKTGAEAEIAGNVIITGVTMRYRCDKFAGP